MANERNQLNWCEEEETSLIIRRFRCAEDAEVRGSHESSIKDFSGRMSLRWIRRRGGVSGQGSAEQRRAVCGRGPCVRRHAGVARGAGACRCWCWCALSERERERERRLKRASGGKVGLRMREAGSRRCVWWGGCREELSCRGLWGLSNAPIGELDRQGHHQIPRTEAYHPSLVCLIAS